MSKPRSRSAIAVSSRLTSSSSTSSTSGGLARRVVGQRVGGRHRRRRVTRAAWPRTAASTRSPSAFRPCSHRRPGRRLAARAGGSRSRHSAATAPARRRWPTTTSACAPHAAPPHGRPAPAPACDCGSRRCSEASKARSTRSTTLVRAVGVEFVQPLQRRLVEHGGEPRGGMG